MDSFRNMMRWLINPFVVGGMFAVALLLTGLVFGLVWFTRPAPAPPAPGTAVLSVIQAPTATPLPTLTPTPQPAATSTQQAPPSPPAGVIAVEAYVRIEGTEGDGLRLRADPGLAGEVRILGGEDEIFQVKDGPVETDGFTWWYLASPSDPARRGWGVSNYLAPEQSP